MQPREFTEFNGEICITSSVMAVNVAQGGFFYYKPALMCKSVATIANPSITWVDRIDGNALLGMGNRDLFYLEKFPGFMGHDQALFASINNYGYNSNISLGGYQVWYTFGDLDANNKFVWHQLIANGFGDAAAQMGMTMKYWNQHMYIGSATWMGLIMTPASQIYGVGKVRSLFSHCHFC